MSEERRTGAAQRSTARTTQLLGHPSHGSYSNNSDVNGIDRGVPDSSRQISGPGRGSRQARPPYFSEVFTAPVTAAARTSNRRAVNTASAVVDHQGSRRAFQAPRPEPSLSYQSVGGATAPPTAGSAESQTFVGGESLPRFERFCCFGAKMCIM